MVSAALRWFSIAFDRSTSIGSMSRLPFDVLRNRDTVVPILRGPARGYRWLTRSSGHNVWLGFYEPEANTPLRKLVKANSVFYDVGGNVGYYSLLASRLVGPLGRVITFEPVKANLAFLKRHLELNAIQNVAVIPRALADRVTTGTMVGGGTTTRLCESCEPEGMIGEAVEVDTLDHLVGSGQTPAPDFIKVDIEGGEVEFLRGGLETLDRYHPPIFLATHSEDLKQECCKLLSNLNYSCTPLGLGREDELLCKPAA